MAIQKEFIVDIIKKYDNYAGFENVIAFIQARWKLTDPLYPAGVTYHLFTCKLNLNGLNPDTFKPIDQVTNEEMEQWCVNTITTTQQLEILNQAINTVKYSHELNSMTTYYTNPNML